MDQSGVGHQVLLENQTLANVTSALRATIGWKYQGPDLSRNLSSLTFIAKSYKRHFQRLFELEAEGGYMSVVLESHPELSDMVASLEQEHREFGKALGRILARLRRVTVTDRATFAAIAADLSALLDRIDAHNLKEADLLQEALLRDEGGEG